jgi:hypothetical protein
MNQEFETPEIMDDFSPLDAPVKQRSYTSHKVYTDAEVVPDLEEPTFQAPNFNDFDEPSAEAPEEKRVFNESYSELDGKEKTMGAEMMAEMTLDLYTKGCEYLGKVPQISESKLDRLIAEGDIDPSIEIPTEAGNIGVKDFAQEFNNSIKGAFEVDDEFREKVTPPLVRVFKKRGVGMTDEQLLLYYFGTDMFTRGAQAFMLKKTANSILDSLKENTMAIRESQVNRPAPKPRPEPDTTSRPRNINNTDSEPIDTDFDEPVMKVVRGRKAKPKTNLEEQIEFFEPEESGSSVFQNLKDEGGFKHETQDVSGMPSFGDASILNEIEKIANQNSDTPNTSVRRKRTTLGVKKTTTRKPRGTK